MQSALAALPAVRPELPRRLVRAARRGRLRRRRSPRAGRARSRRLAAASRSPARSSGSSRSTAGSSSSSASTGLGALVRLRSGRLPRVCTAGALRGARSSARAPAVHGARTGSTSSGSASPTCPTRRCFGSGSTPGRIGRSHLLARRRDRVRPDPAARRLLPRPQLDRARSPPAGVHVWEIDARPRPRVARAGGARGAGRRVRAQRPRRRARSARASTAGVAGRRLSLVGGEISALLLGFALVAAVGLRRGLAAERRRLVQRGATRCAGARSPRRRDRRDDARRRARGAARGRCGRRAPSRGGAGFPAAPCCAHGPGTRRAPARAAALAGRDGRARRRRASRAERVAGAPGAHRSTSLAVARRRGRRDRVRRGAARRRHARDGRRRDASSSCCRCSSASPRAVAVARLLGPADAGWPSGCTRRSPPSLRLAMLALARAPARTAATAAFLVVAVGLALFAAGYRSTLERGAGDQAAFAVPLDFTLDRGAAGSSRRSRLRRSRASSGSRRASSAYPVVRQTAEVPGPGTSVLSPTVLGLPPAALAQPALAARLRGRLPLVDARRHGSAPTRRRRSAASRSRPGRRSRCRRDVRGAPVELDLAADAPPATPCSCRSAGERAPGRLVARATPRAAARRSSGSRSRSPRSEAVGARAPRGRGRAVGDPARVDPRSARSGPARATLTDWRGWVARGGVARRRRAALVRVHDRARRCSYAGARRPTAGRCA